jgi:hypothetical protein
MLGILFGYVITFAGGICAILFSILANRLKSDVFFILGCVFTGFMLIYIIYNYEWMWSLMNNGVNAIFGLVILSFVVIPVIFLIQAKSGTPYGGRGDSEVTDAYLEEVINSADEKIDFEDDLDKYEIDESDFESL